MSASSGDRGLTSHQQLDAARDAALAAMANAYAPYSSFRVGAAIICGDGSISVGCNVENCAYPAGLCAERAALSSAIASGQRTFSVLVVMTEADDPTPPCGLCRQALVEFAPSLEVVSVTSRGATARWGLGELLAHPFTPASLAHT
ncbi:MAG: cytidine deaminase [Gemmatimonadaceae bacterium]